MEKSILLFEWAVWFFVLVLPPQFPTLGLLAIHGATGFFISHCRSSSCVLRHRSQSCPFSQLCSGALCAANFSFDLVFAVARKLVSRSEQRWAILFSCGTARNQFLASDLFLAQDFKAPVHSSTWVSNCWPFLLSRFDSISVFVSSSRNSSLISFCLQQALVFASTGQIWSSSVEIFLCGWFLTAHSICLPSDFPLGDFSVRLILPCSSVSWTRVLWPLFCGFVYESNLWFCVNCCRVLPV
jgi:hypothetical protein